MSRITEILEASWLVLFLISIIFIFLIINRELGDYTRKMKTWRRISYSKMLPRFSLTSLHFSRKGQLLTNTSENICRSIRKDLLDYLRVTKGYTKDEIEELVKDKEMLYNLFPDKKIVDFIYNPALWIRMIEPEESQISKFFKRFNILFKDKDITHDSFYIELITVIQNVKKIIDTG